MDLHSEDAFQRTVLFIKIDHIDGGLIVDPML